MTEHLAQNDRCEVKRLTEHEVLQAIHEWARRRVLHGYADTYEQALATFKADSPVGQQAIVWALSPKQPEIM